MRLAGRLQAAIEILDDVLGRHRPVSLVLKDWGAAHRFAGSKDRAAIGNIVHDALRHRLSLGCAMESDAPRALALATLVRDWGMPVEALLTETADDPHGPGPPTTDEQARLVAPLPDDLPPHVAADVPEWLWPAFSDLFGDDAIAEGQALAGRPPLDLRVNTLKTKRAKAADALARLGAVPTELSPVGLRIPPVDGVRRHPPLAGEDLYERGRIEVQDEGSQLAALLADAKPGDQALDLCAGAGGKTLALAACMENRGQIFATDRDRRRLAPLFGRAGKAGVRNMQTLPYAERGRLDRRMDLVVIDAPCTGSGTWRRHPDIKWKLTPASLARRIEEQDQALDEAAAAAKLGGRLAYVTCSLLPQENDARVAAFIGRTPEFEPLDALARFEALTGTRCARATTYGVQMSPQATETDGFYVALLRRTGSA